jgi:hypothetical protein
MLDAACGRKTDDDGALLLVCSVFAGRLTKTFFVWVKLQLAISN